LFISYIFSKHTKRHGTYSSWSHAASL